MPDRPIIPKKLPSSRLWHGAGFHYYRHQLDAMGDPAEAHAKRGAHWTFDAPAFVAAVKDIRDKGKQLELQHCPDG